MSSNTIALLRLAFIVLVVFFSYNFRIFGMLCVCLRRSCRECWFVDVFVPSLKIQLFGNTVWVCPRSVSPKVLFCLFVFLFVFDKMSSGNSKMNCSPHDAYCSLAIISNVVKFQQNLLSTFVLRRTLTYYAYERNVNACECEGGAIEKGGRRWRVWAWKKIYAMPYI